MIVLCYDGSGSAKHAITTAHALVGQSPALLLHVWQPPAAFLGPDPFGGIEMWSGPQVAELEAMATERANRTVEYGVELARDGGFTVEGRLERSASTVWRTILDVAEEVDAQLVVAGARGLSPVQSLLLGSVSGALIHHSKRPMLIVPPPEEAVKEREEKG